MNASDSRLVTTTHGMMSSIDKDFVVSVTGLAFRLFKLFPLMVFGLLTGSMARFRGAPRSDHLANPSSLLTEVSTLQTGPFASRRHHFQCPTITDSHAQTINPLRRPDCTLSCLRAEEYERPVTQPKATPRAVFEDDPLSRSSAGRLSEP